MKCLVDNVNELNNDTRISYASILYNEEYGEHSFEKLSYEAQMSYAFNESFVNQYLCGIKEGTRSALPVFSSAFLERLNNQENSSMPDLMDERLCNCKKAPCIGIFYDDKSLVLVSAGAKIYDKYMFNIVSLMRCDYVPFMYNTLPSYMTPLCSESYLYYMNEYSAYSGNLTIADVVHQLEESSIIRFANTHAEVS